MGGGTKDIRLSSIDRKAHILKAEKTLAMPRHLLFVDTETRQKVLDDHTVRQDFRLGWACYYYRGHGRHLDKETWFEIKDIGSFWDFVYRHTTKKTKLWVIARNSVFDFTVLQGWRHLKAAGYKLKFFYQAGMCAIISVHKKDSSIVFLDSGNWFVESLAKTGERIGMPKLNIDFATCSRSELSIYCRRDVQIELENFKLFIKFLEENIVGRLCYTRGSTAMAAYLFRHYKTPIYIHNNAQAIALERESYRGGRTECFYIGDLNNDDYYIVDVNSLYPFVMRNNSYPVKYGKTVKTPSLRALRKALGVKAVVAKVIVDTDEPVYALKRDRTIFPVGRFTVTLCTPELKYALAFKHIVSIEKMIVYEQADIFRSYVDKFYSLRLDFRSAGVTEYVEMCKKMLNSLYGKFGQKAEEWTKIGDAPNEPDRIETTYYADTNRRGAIRYLLGEVWELTGHGECFDSFPAIASHVTAYARMYLWGLMQIAGSENYYYCDTDSLIINKVGLCSLKKTIDESSLGGLKIDNAGSSVQLRGLKDYSFGAKVVIKGVRKNAIRVCAGVYTQDSWPSFKGLLRRRQANEYTVTTITKHLNREYTKGTVLNTGQVVPFVLDE